MAVLRDAESAPLYEPLVVALRMLAGESPKVAVEITEVANDVVARIEERRAELGK